MTNEWRSVLAALANTDARSIYAEVVLGLPQTAAISLKKRERAVTTLRNAGLLLLAFMVVAGSQQSGASMVWLDKVTFFGLAIMLIGLYYLSNQLIDLHLRVQKLRSQT